jgi:hypothetical protein
MSRIVPKSPAPEDADALAAHGTDALRPLDPEWPPAARGAFFGFRWSITEVALDGGRTKVQGRRVELADGRLRTETFEGEFGPQAFGEAVRDAQQRMLAQCAVLLNPWAWLLPAARKPHDEP